MTIDPVVERLTLRCSECRQPRQTLAGCLKSTGLDSGALTAEWAQWIINHWISQWLWSPACHIMLHQIIFGDSMFFFFNIVTFRSDLMVAVPTTAMCVHPRHVEYRVFNSISQSFRCCVWVWLPLDVAMSSFVDLVWSRKYVEAVMLDGRFVLCHIPPKKAGWTLHWDLLPPSISAMLAKSFTKFTQVNHTTAGVALFCNSYHPLC